MLLLVSGAAFSLLDDRVKRQYLAINAHWIAPDAFEYKQRCLAVRFFPGRSTAAHTAALIKKVLVEYGIPQEACLFACTDNCSTMEATVRDYFPAMTRIFCAPHWMQLVVLDALKGEPLSVCMVPE